MKYQIAFSPSASRQLAVLPQRDQHRIRERIDRLAEDPRPPGVKLLRGAERYFRVRLGDYRIVYAIEEDHLVVLVIRIGHRSEVHRRL